MFPTICAETNKLWLHLYTRKFHSPGTFVYLFIYTPGNFRQLLKPSNKRSAKMTKPESTWQWSRRERLGSILGLERLLRVGNGKWLQYSCLENSVDRRAWQPTDWAFKKSDMTEWLSVHSHTHSHTHAVLGNCY